MEIEKLIRPTPGHSYCTPNLAASHLFVDFLIKLTPTDNTPVITAGAVAVAFVFSAGIGVLAGLFPAFKAARLDPIEALRYE